MQIISIKEVLFLENLFVIGIINMAKAFLVGGIFCLIAQLLIDYTRLTPARILTMYVVAGVIMSALGLYEPIYRFAGAGISVPLIGFGNALATGAKEMALEKGFVGALSGGLSATALGISATIILSVISALVYFPKDKA